MSKVAIQGNASGTGTLTIAAPNTNTDRTLTLPDEAGTVLTSASDLTGVTGVPNPLTSGTAVAATSGTAIDFTGIPSWVKRITVMLDGVSTNGSSQIIAQLGDSGGVETTGYNASVAIIAASNDTTRLTKFTTYFGITWTENAAYINYGSLVFTNLSGNTWTASGVLYQDEGASFAHVIMVSGAKTLSATLDRVRISTAGGTATFDAGSINILYE